MDDVTAAYWRDRRPSAVEVPPRGVAFMLYRYIVWYLNDNGRESVAGPTAWIYAPPIEDSGAGLLHDLFARADEIAADVERGALHVVTLQLKRCADGRRVPAMQVRVRVDAMYGPRRSDGPHGR